jgi:hypothetical protein
MRIIKSSIALSALFFCSTTACFAFGVYECAIDHSAPIKWLNPSVTFYAYQNQMSEKQLLAVKKAVEIFNKNTSGASINLIVTTAILTMFPLNGRNEFAFHRKEDWPWFGGKSVLGLTLQYMLCSLGFKPKFLETDIIIQASEGGIANYEYDLLWIPEENTITDEKKTNLADYGGSKNAIVDVLLHEIGHAFGLHHESRYSNIMGNGIQYSANGEYVRSWMGEDATRALSLLYDKQPLHDLSVHKVKRTELTTPQQPWDYALHQRTYVYDVPIPTDINETEYDTKKPQIRYKVVKGQRYYFEYVYENNGSTNIPPQTVQFYQSTDDEAIETTDLPLLHGDGTPVVDYIDFTLQDPTLGNLYPDLWVILNLIPYTNIRMSADIVVDPNIGDSGPGIAVTKLSEVYIPCEAKEGPSVIGPYIDPDNLINETYEENNATYHNVNVFTDFTTCGTSTPVDDHFTDVYRGIYKLDVLANDVGDGTPTLISFPSGGYGSIDDHGMLVYWPNPGARGVFTFGYVLTDFYGNRSAPATISLTITD